MFMESEERKQVMCQVGGWKIMAVPGDTYTFGQGATCWGPYNIKDVREGMDVEGVAIAEPLSIHYMNSKETTDPANVSGDATEKLQFHCSCGQISELKAVAMVNKKDSEGWTIPHGVCPVCHKESVLIFETQFILHDSKCPCGGHVLVATITEPSIVGEGVWQEICLGCGATYENWEFQGEYWKQEPKEGIPCKYGFV